MLSKKLLLPLVILFAIASIPHFQDAVHALVHAKGIDHTHMHEEPSFGSEQTSQDHAESDHHEDICFDRAPLAAAPSLQNQFSKLFHILFSSALPSWAIDLETPLKAALIIPKDCAPPGGLSKAEFRTHPSNAPPAV